MSKSDEKEKGGTISHLDEKRGAVKKGRTADNDPSVEKRKEDADEDDALGHVTGGEAVDGQGCIDSTQSAKPVPRDALKVDIPAADQAEGLGNVAKPGHDNAKMADDEESEDVDGECEDDEDKSSDDK